MTAQQRQPHRTKKPRSGGRRVYANNPVPEKKKFIPKPRQGEIRTLFFGGVSEIGKNLYAVEYNDTIILFEYGTMFGENTTPGVNALMPNIEYLRERKNNIRALVISEASLAHIGAIAHAIRDIGSPTIYCRPLTRAVIEERHKRVRRTDKLSFHEVNKDEAVSISDTITLNFFGISDHTPTALGAVVETPSGNVAYIGGLKIAHRDGVVSAKEEQRFAIAKNATLVLADSVSAERPGFALSDEIIAQNYLAILQQVPHRTLLPLFPSQIWRNAHIVEGALKLGKKIYVEGASLFENLKTVIDMQLINVPQEALIPIEEITEDDRDKNILILTAAAENEEYDMLEKLSQETCKYTTINYEDTVIFSEPIIAANARSSQNLKDRLSRLGATIQVCCTSDVRASCHPGKGELRQMHQMLQPKYFIPVQGYHYMLTAHAYILQDIGVSPDSCVVPENGTIIDISPDGKVIKKQKQRLEVGSISVDGHEPMAIHDIVIRDRQTLAQEGILIIVIFIDQKKLVLKKSPDILSRGFIYLKESRDLIARTRIVIKKAAEKTIQERGEIDIDDTKKAIQKETQSFLINETNKKPIIIPVLFT